MKAITLYETGDVDKMIYDEIATPILQKGEVLVRVKATSVNPIDVKIRSNKVFLDAFLGTERPAKLGYDFSGDIVEKAKDVTSFAVGDAVFGFMPLKKASAYAEFVSVPIDIITKKPSNISYEQAAVTTVAAATAYNPLANIFQLKKGDKILILAGSGGVGHFAIQIAKHLGATVITTCSAKNRDFVLSLGADRHIDYTIEDFSKILQNVDFVLDTIGGKDLDHCVDVTKDGGKIITTIPNFPEAIALKAAERNIELKFGGSRYSSDDLDALAYLLHNGIIRPFISVYYSFDQLKDAHRQIESGRTKGKVVVTL